MTIEIAIGIAIGIEKNDAPPFGFSVDQKTAVRTTARNDKKLDSDFNFDSEYWKRGRPRGIEPSFD